MKREPSTTAHGLVNGVGTAANGSGDATPTPQISPTETRRTINNMLQAGATAAAQQHAMTATSGSADAHSHGHGHGMGYLGSSPLLARASLLSGLNRTASASPFRRDLGMQTATPTQGEGVMSVNGPGMGRFGFR